MLLGWLLVAMHYDDGLTSTVMAVLFLYSADRRRASEDLMGLCVCALQYFFSIVLTDGGRVKI